MQAKGETLPAQGAKAPRRGTAAMGSTDWIETDARIEETGRNSVRLPLLVFFPGGRNPGVLVIFGLESDQATRRLITVSKNVP